MNSGWRRGGRWVLGGLLLLLLLLALGRAGQVYLDSRLQGARGPYLQMPAPDAITIRWQTLRPQAGVVRYGTAADRLEQQAAGGHATVHEVRITSLQPDTRYYYSVERAVHSFRTAPLPGAARSLRLWVQGDAGRAIPTTLQGRDAALQWAADHPREGLPPIDLWLTTGDNAYRSGKDGEFQRHLFAAYPELLPTTPYLPVYGNHDARRNAFHKLFTFPEEGELGGLPSGSEHYFSIDYGQAHLIFLDSEEGGLGEGSAMLQWLQRDLAATRQPWLIALLHHPAYTKGSHDSDDGRDSRGRMRRVRENVLPLLERGGVDLALFGHSHVYERSHLMACHYGGSASFREEFNRQQSAEGHYRKSVSRQPYGGTLYNVVGSSAYADNGPLDHPAMAVAMSKAGSLMIDIANGRLGATFIGHDGTVLDRYTITKEANRPAAVAPCAAP
ncbi:MAG: metallophosphoesterase family protein [Gammaproteobacteria bacterium]|nr:metallophosphoesterase family protein [Gammaproteobacteria bacterium]